MTKPTADKLVRWLETAVIGAAVAAGLGAIAVKQFDLQTVSAADAAHVQMRSELDSLQRINTEIDLAILERLDCLLLDVPQGCRKTLRPYRRQP